MLPGHALFKETSATASVAAGGSLSMLKLGGCREGDLGEQHVRPH
jgi:hypothetical protein